MQAEEEVLEVSASGGRGVGGRCKREVEVLEVSSSGGRGVGGKFKWRKRCWR